MKYRRRAIEARKIGNVYECRDGTGKTWKAPAAEFEAIFEEVYDEQTAPIPVEVAKALNGDESVGYTTLSDPSIRGVVREPHHDATQGDKRQKKS